MIDKAKTPKQLRKETDEKYKEYKRSIREIEKIQENLTDAKNKKAYANVERYTDQLSHAKAKKDSIAKEYAEAQRAEFGDWSPKSLDREESDD